MEQSARKFRNLPLHSTGKGADMSEGQAHQCMTPGQWTWLLCSVSVIPENKLSLEELNQLIGIKLLTSGFLEMLGYYSQISRGGKFPFCRSPVDTHVGEACRGPLKAKYSHIAVAVEPPPKEEYLHVAVGALWIQNACTSIQLLFGALLKGVYLPVFCFGVYYMRG